MTRDHRDIGIAIVLALLAVATDSHLMTFAAAAWVLPLMLASLVSSASSAAVAYRRLREHARPMP